MDFFIGGGGGGGGGIGVRAGERRGVVCGCVCTLEKVKFFLFFLLLRGCFLRMV